MKHYLKPIYSLLIFTLLFATSIQAGSGEKMVIALKTDDFELTETDISTLAVGEAHTIETESGKVIDILRTADGAEIYVDGELLELNMDHEGLHEEHMVKKHVIKKHVEVICDNDEECEKDIVIHAEGDHDVSSWVTEDGENVFIHKEIEISCTDEDDETSCTDKVVWISDGEDIDLEELHEVHGDGQAHKVIIIEKDVIHED
jgi:hypothetical protein